MDITDTSYILRTLVLTLFMLVSCLYASAGFVQDKEIGRLPIGKFSKIPVEPASKESIAVALSLLHSSDEGDRKTAARYLIDILHYQQLDFDSVKKIRTDASFTLNQWEQVKWKGVAHDLMYFARNLQSEVNRASFDRDFGNLIKNMWRKDLVLQIELNSVLASVAAAAELEGLTSIEAVAAALRRQVAEENTSVVSSAIYRLIDLCANKSVLVETVPAAFEYARLLDAAIVMSRISPACKRKSAKSPVETLMSALPGARGVLQTWILRDIAYLDSNVSSKALMDLYRHRRDYWHGSDFPIYIQDVLLSRGLITRSDKDFVLLME